MDAVPLDPNGYRGSYKLVGGQLSLDLINTVSWPGRAREHDWFDPVDNIPRWAAAAGILSARSEGRFLDRLAADVEWAGRELGAARRIRAAVAAVLVPFVRGDDPSERAIATLNRLLVRAASRRRLSPLTADRRMAWTFVEPTSSEDLLAPAVLNASDVLIDLDPDRLRYCPSCDWLFHDTTRNGRRTWCDMADCGSRAKARRHYQRHNA